MNIDIKELIKIIHTLPVSLIALILSNIFLIAGFVIGKLAMYKYENAVKFFAYFSVVMCILFVLYFISVLWFAISNLYFGNMPYAAIFLVFLFLPFIIGRFASYEKIHLYTNIQILSLIVSLLLALSFI